ncbi:quinone oxidoreductase family protein [Meiothermus ruber]|jgi:NADPH2:quinone reductase|uniref:Alcohol dehydrogenase zinc-binding domain protein n=1 Tax=Meiothermus ruber (strain ATCC 35948 / DSM 1279 / VKM B-1258 / 21) TaxID=504728 RepID=D3PMM1_MEIRD|nr:quinone oxidoreductase [Meiothermus ruber]ADD27196.1 Alcohol dehydrogenase zinc-binding domain protein [Meiothermus ruber DSM 1279]AGK03648.1 Alcohol dehydrogenase zinc-binding domain-containing protein [Meiothermus ruber DSM 1279]MCL6530950.1 quinone oxidoreductase [Meiothermus ruber]GAO74119.1 Alcohol dehydrogenase zinc-binding domain-containing protein [Meiothermus ruber H328]
MKAIRVHQPGGLEALQLEEIPVPTPGEGQALVRLQAIGVNFIDTYKRSGLYSVPTPFTVGEEGAGVVEAVGPGVAGVKPGDRVVYSNVQGSYAEYAVVPADKLVQIPDGLEAKIAVAGMLQGMTAHYLVYSTYPLKAGETCLVHAGAGGVGLLLIQMAKQIGATVIATASSEGKRALAKEAGADYTLPYEGFDQKAREITGGKGVDVVYDGVGQSTWEGSLNSLRIRGMLVLYGQSSGPVPPFNPQVLNQKGGLYLTRPSLWHYTQTREELEWRAGDVMRWALEGRLKIRIGAEFPLAQAAQAHRALQSRETTGKVLLIP